jgi:hypothetical protein
MANMLVKKGISLRLRAFRTDARMTAAFAQCGSYAL